MTDSAPRFCFVSAEIVERDLRNAVLPVDDSRRMLWRGWGRRESGASREKDDPVSRIGFGSVRPMLARLLSG
jgi:hypothetical protein